MAGSIVQVMASGARAVIALGPGGTDTLWDGEPFPGHAADMQLPVVSIGGNRRLAFPIAAGISYDFGVEAQPVPPELPDRHDPEGRLPQGHHDPTYPQP